MRSAPARTPMHGPRVGNPTDRRQRMDPRVFYVHHYDEVFDPANPLGVRIVVKVPDLNNLKEEATRALSTSIPVRFLAFPTGVAINDVIGIPNQSHIFAWTKNIRPRHPPPAGIRLLHLIKQQDAPDSEEQEAAVSVTDILRRRRMQGGGLPQRSSLSLLPPSFGNQARKAPVLRPAPRRPAGSPSSVLSPPHVPPQSSHSHQPPPEYAATHSHTHQNQYDMGHSSLLTFDVSGGDVSDSSSEGELMFPAYAAPSPDYDEFEDSEDISMTEPMNRDMDLDMGMGMGMGSAPDVPALERTHERHVITQQSDYYREDSALSESSTDVGESESEGPAMSLAQIMNASRQAGPRGAKQLTPVVTGLPPDSYTADPYSSMAAPELSFEDLTQTDSGTTPILRSRRRFGLGHNLPPMTQERVVITVIEHPEAIPPGAYSAPPELTLSADRVLPGDEDSEEEEGEEEEEEAMYDEDEEEVDLLVEPGPFPNAPGEVEGKLLRWWDMDYPARKPRLQFLQNIHLRPEEIPPGQYSPAAVRLVPPTRTAPSPPAPVRPQLSVSSDLPPLAQAPAPAAPSADATNAITQEELAARINQAFETGLLAPGPKFMEGLQLMRGTVIPSTFSFDPVSNADPTSPAPLTPTKFEYTPITSANKMPWDFVSGDRKGMAWYLLSQLQPLLEKMGDSHPDAAAWATRVEAVLFAEDGGAGEGEREGEGEGGRTATRPDGALKEARQQAAAARQRVLELEMEVEDLREQHSRPRPGASDHLAGELADARAEVASLRAQLAKQTAAASNAEAAAERANAELSAVREESAVKLQWRDRRMERLRGHHLTGDAAVAALAAAHDRELSLQRAFAELQALLRCDGAADELLGMVEEWSEDNKATFSPKTVSTTQGCGSCLKLSRAMKEREDLVRGERDTADELGTLQRLCESQQTALALAVSHIDEVHGAACRHQAQAEAAAQRMGTQQDASEAVIEAEGQARVQLRRVMDVADMQVSSLQRSAVQRIDSLASRVAGLGSALQRVLAVHVPGANGAGKQVTEHKREGVRVEAREMALLRARVAELESSALSSTQANGYTPNHALNPASPPFPPSPNGSAPLIRRQSGSESPHDLKQCSPIRTSPRKSVARPEPTLGLQCVVFDCSEASTHAVICSIEVPSPGGEPCPSIQPFHNPFPGLLAGVHSAELSELMASVVDSIDPDVVVVGVRPWLTAQSEASRNAVLRMVHAFAKRYPGQCLLVSLSPETLTRYSMVAAAADEACVFDRVVAVSAQPAFAAVWDGHVPTSSSAVVALSGPLSKSLTLVRAGKSSEVNKLWGSALVNVSSIDGSGDCCLAVDSATRTALLGDVEDETDVETLLAVLGKPGEFGGEMEEAVCLALRHLVALLGSNTTTVHVVEQGAWVDGWMWQHFPWLQEQNTNPHDVDASAI